MFGVTDSMDFAGANPFPGLNRDVVAGIVKKYLEPTLQCDVHSVRSTAGNEHPVIIVSSHGAVPVCAKANGPELKGKGPQGIVQGVHYTRKPGPESAPVTTAADWAPIIRRCAMHERAAILTALDAALRGANTTPTAIADVLKIWYDAVRPIYLKDIAARDLPPFYSKSYYHFRYAIDRDDRQLLDANRLIEILRQVNAEVRDLVWTGWSMFHPFSGLEIAPFFNTDEASGEGDRDFLETALLRNTTSSYFATDMWRVSVDGKATIIRCYTEDDVGFTAQTQLAQGTWFSRQMMVCALAELVRHARGMAERFDAPTKISFRCEWHGLENRILHDPLGWFPESRAKSDRRVTTGNWPVSSLGNVLDEIVSELAQPVVRLFTNDFAVTPEWVRQQRPRWKL